MTLEAKVRARRALFAGLSANPRMLAMPDHDGRTVHLVCRDPGDPTRWRASRFDEQGPAGHVGPTSFVDALDAARDYGADLSRATNVTPDTVDAVTAGWIL